MRLGWSRTARRRSRVLALTLALCLSIGPARAETFVFRSGEKVTGKLLVEFDTLFFVALDGQSTCFVARAELAEVIDVAGTRLDIEAPTFRGALAPYGGPAPLAAATDVSGEAWLQRGEGARQPAGDDRGGRGGPASAPPGDDGAVFLRLGDRFTTGSSTIARVVLPGGAVFKLSPDACLGFAEGEGGAPQLETGEAVAQAGGRPCALGLLKPLTARLEPDAKVLLTRLADGVHAVAQAGDSELTFGTDARAALEPGNGLEVVRVGPQRWRLTADAVNLGDVAVTAPDAAHTLRPGETLVLGADAEPLGEPWRIVEAVGDVTLRRAGAASFAPVARDRQVTVGAGDVVKAAAGGHAVLVRAPDGASFTLEEASTVEVGPALALTRGRAKLDAGSAAVVVATPCGPASLAATIVDLARVEEGLAGALDVAARAGEAELPVGAPATVRIAAGTTVRLRADGAPPAGGAAPAGGPLAAVARAGVQQGRGAFASRAAAGRPDPGFRGVLLDGQSLGVRQDPDGPALLLPGDRTLRFESGDVQAELTFDAGARVAFASGARATLREGLVLALACVNGLPELRFREGPSQDPAGPFTGPRLLLAAPLPLRVENPTVVVEGGEVLTTLELLGRLTARLEGGAALAACALAPRDGDRLEVAVGTRVLLEARGDALTRLHLPDGRQLWLQDGAPNVQARLADGVGNVFLTMLGQPALGFPALRRMTVLATRDGEFLIIADDSPGLGEPGIDDLRRLAGPAGTDALLSRDRIRDLLDVPLPDSPSGP